MRRAGNQWIIFLHRIENDLTAIEHAAIRVSFKTGWNELLLCSNVYAAQSDLGAAIVADPTILWKLKVSGPVP